MGQLSKLFFYYCFSKININILYMNTRKKRASKKRRKYLLDKAKKSPKKPIKTPPELSKNKVLKQLKHKYKTNHRSKKRYYNNTPVNRKYNRVGKPRGTKRITPTMKKKLEEKERRLENRSRRISRYPVNNNSNNNNNNSSNNNNGMYLNNTGYRVYRSLNIPNNGIRIREKRNNYLYNSNNEFPVNRDLYVREEGIRVPIKRKNSSNWYNSNFDYL